MGKRRTLQRRKAKTMALKMIKSRGKRKQIGGLGPAAGIALGMALPMLLNSGTNIVGGIFGKGKQQQPRQQQQQQPQQQRKYVPPAQPQWMGGCRRRRDYYYDDY